MSRWWIDEAIRSTNEEYKQKEMDGPGISTCRICGGDTPTDGPQQDVVCDTCSTNKEFKCMRGRTLGDFFTAAPRGTTVLVPHITLIKKTGPQQLEFYFGEMDFIQYKEGWQ